MKTTIALIICLFCYNTLRAQDSPPVIKQFLTALQKNNWSYDDLAKKYLCSSSGTQRSEKDKEKIRSFNKMTLAAYHKEISNIDVPNLSVTRYDLADAKLQTLLLDEATMKNTYIVTNKAGFKRFFLVEKNKICAWIIFKNSAFIAD